MGRAMPGAALAITLVAVLCAGASAQSGCTAAIVGLAPCMTYILGNSSAPAPPCCTQLAGVVRSQPQCLCMVLNGGAAQLGLTLNQTRALALPGACNVQTPSASLCNGGPAASPAASPQGAPAASSSPAAPSEPSSPTPAAPAAPSLPRSTSPATPSTPSTTPSVPAGGSGSKTTEASAGSSTTMVVLPFLMLLFVASHTVN